MTPTQIVQLSFGGVCAFAVLIFLMTAFFKKDELTAGQWAILRFLCALCAAFAGFFIAGQAIFQMSGQTPEGTAFAISGTAGFALFFTVWFFFPRLPQVAPTTPPPPQDAFNFTVPESGWTFKSTAEAIAKTQNRFAEFDGFSAEDLNAPLNGRELHFASAVEAINALRYLRRDGIVKAFTVRDENPSYRIKLTVKNKSK
jgi:hypothetical protein